MLLRTCTDEIIVGIAKHLGRAPRSYLSRTCRRLRILLTPLVLETFKWDEGEWNTSDAVLRWAIMNHRQITVQLALDRGAPEHLSTSHVDRRGDCSSLTLAVSCSNIEIVQMLLDHFGSGIVNPKIYCHYTPLQAAAARGDPRITNLLLENGAHIHGGANEFGHPRDTPLSIAARYGTAVVAELLIGVGADPSEDAAMISALGAKNIWVARVLVRAGAQIDVGLWQDEIWECHGKTEDEIRAYLEDYTGGGRHGGG